MSKDQENQVNETNSQQESIQEVNSLNFNNAAGTAINYSSAGHIIHNLNLDQLAALQSSSVDTQNLSDLFEQALKMTRDLTGAEIASIVDNFLEIGVQQNPGNTNAGNKTNNLFHAQQMIEGITFDSNDATATATAGFINTNSGQNTGEVYYSQYLQEAQASIGEVNAYSEEGEQQNTGNQNNDSLLQQILDVIGNDIEVNPDHLQNALQMGDANLAAAFINNNQNDEDQNIDLQEALRTGDANLAAALINNNQNNEEITNNLQEAPADIGEVNADIQPDSGNQNNQEQLDYLQVAQQMGGGINVGQVEGDTQNQQNTAQRNNIRRNRNRRLETNKPKPGNNTRPSI